MTAAGSQGGRHADVLVIFGITGDLARVMTFQALYRLERRRLLDCPIVGVAVDEWTDDELRERARASIEATGEDLDDEVFARLAARLAYIAGDFTDAGTYERLARELGDSQAPVFYLAIPPSLFATVIERLARAELTGGARVVVEKPFGHDLASARELNERIHEFIDESRIYRIDHFLGKVGLSEILYLRFANAMFEPVWNRDHLASVQITMAEDFGVSDRGHFYDRVGALRDVVVNHVMQIVGATAMEPPAGGDPATLKDGLRSVLRAIPDADPAHYVRGQYDGYRTIDGVASDSTTETYAALRLEIENWRWSDVPFFIRAAKRLPATLTEVRLVFEHPPRLGFRPKGSRRPEPDQLTMRLDPTAGVRIELDAQRPDAPDPEMIRLDAELAREGEDAPTPYEVLLAAAIAGDSARFRRQDAVEESWRIFQPLLDAPPPVDGYAPGSWGPQAADRLLAGCGGWRGPWMPS